MASTSETTPQDRKKDVKIRIKPVDLSVFDIISEKIKIKTTKTHKIIIDPPCQLTMEKKVVLYQDKHLFIRLNGKISLYYGSLMVTTDEKTQKNISKIEQALECILEKANLFKLMTPRDDSGNVYYRMVYDKNSQETDLYGNKFPDFNHGKGHIVFKYWIRKINKRIIVKRILCRVLLTEFYSPINYSQLHSLIDAS